ncbi:hypothetical protein [Nonomuraea wenchangensis]
MSAGHRSGISPGWSSTESSLGSPGGTSQSGSEPRTANRSGPVSSMRRLFKAPRNALTSGE